jgi:hypothetical protein
MRNVAVDDRRMVMRKKRLQFTIRGLIILVALSALVLGFLLEERRILRRQAHFRQEALEYSQLEKEALGSRELYLSLALSMKKSIELQQHWDAMSQGDDRFFPWQPEAAPPGNGFSGRNRLMRELFNDGRKYLALAQVAKESAEEYGELKRRYERAGNRVWLPFTPSPRDVK